MVSAGGQHSGGRSAHAGGQRRAAGQPWDAGPRPQRGQGAAPKLQGPRQGASQQHNKVINRQLSRVAEKGDVAGLLEAVSAHLPEMNGINLATAFHRLAKLTSAADKELEHLKRHAVFQRLFQAVVEHLLGHSLRHPDRSSQAQVDSSAAAGEMPVQCTSIVCWSCATLQLRHKPLLMAIAEISARHLNEFKPYELSNLLWAYAKLSLSPSDLLANVTARLLRRREGEFKVQCLSTIVWSFATLKRRNLVVFASIAKELSAHAQELKPQEISNTLWAFAKSRCAHAELFSALGDAAVEEPKIWSFKPQELSNSIWAFATVGLQHPTLFTKVEAASIRKRHEMVPQNIANILWAFAKLQISSWSRLFSSLLEVSVVKLHQHKPQELSAVIWAAAQCCPGCSSFFDAAAACCAGRLQEFSANALANLVKAVSMVKISNPQFLVSLLRESLTRLPQFKPLAVCNLLRGATAATLNEAFAGHVEQIDGAIISICEHLAPRVDELQPSELQELSATLHMRSAPGSCNLRAAVARAKLRQQELQQHTKHGKALSPKAAHSVGSLSTTESQADEEEEEDAWWNLNTDEIGHSDGSSNPENDVAPEDCGTAHEQPMHIWPIATATVSQTTTKGVPTYSSDGPSRERGGLTLSLASELEGQNSKEAPWRVPLPTPWRGSWPGVLAAKAPPVGLAPCGLPAPTTTPPAVAATTMPAVSRDVALRASPEKVEPYQPQQQGSILQLKLPTLDASCLEVLGMDGLARPIDARAFASSAVFGIGEDWVRMTQGHAEERVVVKRVSTGTLPTTKPVHHLNVLPPLARIVFSRRVKNDIEFDDNTGCFLVSYMHCKHGSLSDWLDKRCSLGRPVQPYEAARIGMGVLLGAEALLCESQHGLGSVQPDNIFMGADEAPRLREPLAGRPGDWGEALKWLSPEEAAGRVQPGGDAWPALSFRLGLLLHCLGSGSRMDPHPGRTGEAVLMGLLSEFGGNTAPMRPDLAAYEGPDILRRVVAACFRIGGQAPPARSAVAAVLEAVASSGPPQSPVKFLP